MALKNHFYKFMELRGISLNRLVKELVGWKELRTENIYYQVILNSS